MRISYRLEKTTNLKVISSLFFCIFWLGYGFRLLTDSVSPFAAYLRELRLRRGIKQKDLAERVGCTPSYLSAIEMGGRGLPQKELMDRLIRELAPTAEESDVMDAALNESEYNIRFPIHAHADEYRLWHFLLRESGRHPPWKIKKLLEFAENLLSQPVLKDGDITD